MVIDPAYCERARRPVRPLVVGEGQVGAGSQQVDREDSADRIDVEVRIERCRVRLGVLDCRADLGPRQPAVGRAQDSRLRRPAGAVERGGGVEDSILAVDAERRLGRVVSDVMRLQKQCVLVL